MTIVVFFSFTRCAVLHHVLLEKIKVSAVFLEIPLRKSVSKVFGGGYEVVSGFGVNFRTRWLVQSTGGLRSYRWVDVHPPDLF